MKTLKCNSLIIVYNYSSIISDFLQEKIVCIKIIIFVPIFLEYAKNKQKYNI